MFLLLFLSFLPLSVLATFPAAFPPTPEGLTTVSSPGGEGVSISYKQTNICETTPGVKSYSGYVHLPPNATEARPYNVNLFFWFFEARQNPQTAPLTLWLQGGPGVPSTPAALGENGPCIVANNSKDTSLNPWSWNQFSNMLYVDQPVQVGFSYDSLVNGTIDEVLSPVAVTPANFSSAPETNGTVLAGTFASGQNATTANTTAIASLAVWHFMQAWIQEFPAYKPANNKFNIWTESYGGHYGPTYAQLFETQNQRIANGSLSGISLGIDTVGLINACVDLLTQMPLYPQMAFNNTYGLQLINETEFTSAVDSFPQCKNLTQTCRAAVSACDGPACDSAAADKACFEANEFCFANMWSAYNNAGRDVFDIAHPALDPFPSSFFASGYFNSREVQQALGVPLNFTGQSAAVSNSFANTGDFVRAGNLEALGRLLDQGVKVALVYGDRDYQCNWLGGEQISLAIPSTLTPSFRAAGYANITTNSIYIGGTVRQSGNLSFSRVFDAGHQVPYYQPETAFRIFERATAGSDIATGQIATSGAGANETAYATTGPSSVFGLKNTVPDPPAPTCYLWDMLQTCTEGQKEAILAGTAVMRDFILVGLVNESTSAGGNGTAGGATGGGVGGRELLGVSVPFLGLVMAVGGSLLMD